jgi:DNA-binding transcriptional LysR family regulator
MPVALGVQHIVPLLAEFKRAHPKLRMDLDFSDSVVDLLGDGYDAAIRVSARLADSSLSARRIGSSPMVISASPDYLRRHGMPQHLSELVRHQRLCYSQQPVESMVPLGRTASDVPADIRVNNGDALKAFALAGMGLIQTPAFVVSDDLASGRLVRVLPGEHLGDYQISVVFPERAFMPLRTRRLIEYLAANLSDLGVPAVPGSERGELAHRLAA